jgi:3'(2'), 5'-bisphosphate nucleotidase
MSIQPVMDTLMESLLQLVRSVGNHILQDHATDRRYRLKSDQSPVTATDLAANRLLQAGLQRLTPGIPILSEESLDSGLEACIMSEPYWVLDPLDGTREFITGLGEFTINIALIEQTQVVRGVVYAPFFKKAYFAIRGQGAYKQEANQPPQRMRSTANRWPLRVLVSRHHRSDQALKNFLQRLYPDDLTKSVAQSIISPQANAANAGLTSESIQLTPCGSALKFGLLAEGVADIYPRLGPTAIWDTAAGQCILEAAGGGVFNAAGEPLCYVAKTSLLNPAFLAVAHPTASTWARYLAN